MCTSTGDSDGLQTANPAGGATFPDGNHVGEETPLRPITGLSNSSSSSTFSFLSTLYAATPPQLPPPLTLTPHFPFHPPRSPPFQLYSSPTPPPLIAFPFHSPPVPPFSSSISTLSSPPPLTPPFLLYPRPPPFPRHSPSLSLAPPFPFNPPLTTPF